MGRACMSRSMFNCQGSPSRDEQCLPFAQDESDCPIECFEQNDSGYPVLKYHEDTCTVDLRCVPEVARDPSKMRTRQLKMEGNRCLAADHGSITAEICNSASESQLWTFAEVPDAAVLV